MKAAKDKLNNHPLSLSEFSLVLGGPVITPDGPGILSTVELTGHNLTVDFERTEKLYYVSQVRPVLTPIKEITKQHEKKCSKIYQHYKSHPNRGLVQVGLWCVRNGYDALGWIVTGQAVEKKKG